MNREQQKIAEDNHSLIFSFMKKNKLSFDAIEDWYGCCAIGLCKAAMFYDQNMNLKFSTLAYVCMHNEVKDIFRQQTKEEQCFSLDYDIADNIELIDCIPDQSSRDFSKVEFFEILNKRFNELSDRNKRIIDDYIHTQYTAKELSGIYGISPSSISTIYNKFFNQIYSDLYESEAE